MRANQAEKVRMHKTHLSGRAIQCSLILARNSFSTVLERCVQALETLSQVAASSSPPQKSMLAVSHSTYLRILLALVSDTPLAESVLWKINNGSVNVVDVNIEGKQRLVSVKSGIFGGLKRSNDLQLSMPECHLIRRNEVRHLDGMQV